MSDFGSREAQMRETEWKAILDHREIYFRPATEAF